MLNCETNTAAMGRKIKSAARAALGQRRNLETFFEHGQWWVTDLNSGAQWSANDAEPGGFSFEQVTQGDEE